MVGDKQHRIGAMKSLYVKSDVPFILIFTTVLMCCLIYHIIHGL
jgi:hypothetical protein